MHDVVWRRWKEAKRDATKSLDIQPVGNGKAHFRRGMANKALGDFAAAQPGQFPSREREHSNVTGGLANGVGRVDFEAALALDPTNKSIVAELEQVKQKVRALPSAICALFEYIRADHGISCPCTHPGVFRPGPRTFCLLDRRSRTLANETTQSRHHPVFLFSWRPRIRRHIPARSLYDP